LKLIRAKKIRFLVAGVLNTLFGYSAYAVLLFIGVSYTVALLLATIFGMVFNYFNFGKFVFYGHRNWLVFYKFAAVYAAVYAMNAAGLWALIKFLSLGPYVGQLIIVPPSVLLSWFLMNHWVFKRSSA